MGWGEEGVGGRGIQWALHVLVAVEGKPYVVFLPKELSHFADASSKTHKPRSALTIVVATKLRINVGTMLQERLADLTTGPILENKITTDSIGEWLKAQIKNKSRNC